MAEMISDLIINKIIGSFINLMIFMLETPTNCIISVIIIGAIALIIKIIYNRFCW